MRNRYLLFIVLSIFLLVLDVSAQKKKTVKKPPAQKPKVEKPKPEKPDTGSDEKKVRDIVAFLEFMLNTLGSNSTPVRDKDVLITESYSKIFRDSKVQVEDDLDEERRVITNKDIVAYLKDVNFFFTNVRFEFTIEDIKSSTLPNGQHFYKVSTRRNLTGTASDGQAVNNTMARFIEINYNPNDQDLKIVSIYTNEFNEKQALTNWWKELSFEWQSLFKRRLALKDSVQLRDIKAITSLEELNISNNQYIQNIEPLSLLINLKSLNISGTNASDLSPIRNLTELTDLDLSRTNTSDLTPLKYSAKLERLNLSRTNVTDISVLEKMPGLQILDISRTRTRDFTSLSKLNKLNQLNLKATLISALTSLENLVELTDVDVSSTTVQDLNPLKGLKSITTLNIDSTRVTSLQALSNLESLKELRASYTLIADLQPLQKLPHLEKIYCDQTGVKQAGASVFMVIRPEILVIFDSKDLMAWWGALTPEWHRILSVAARITTTPAKEELAKVTNLDSINVGNLRSIASLEPLRKLQKLRVIIANNTSIHDLIPLESLNDVEYLDISDTEVNDLSMVSRLSKLKVLRADGSKFQSLDPLLKISTLERIYADHTVIHDITAHEFLEKKPECLLIYKTVHLERWWNNTSEGWKEVFRTTLPSGTTQFGKDGLSRESLHKLVEQQTLTFKDAPVTDLSALSEFIRLKDLHFSGTNITIITPTENIKSLKSLHATNSPIQNIESIGELTDLVDLDLSNTPAADLYILWKLVNLKKLNCSGTQIKRLDPLEKLTSLEYLDCSNTNVSKLSPLDYLPLKTLNCYNTKVTGKTIENFKASHPECKVVYYR